MILSHLAAVKLKDMRDRHDFGCLLGYAGMPRLHFYQLHG